jgi:hypothetical protein
LVSLITDRMQIRQDLFRNEGKIMDSLVNSGYHLHEADAALTLLQNLAQDGEEQEDPLSPEEAETGTTWNWAFPGRPRKKAHHTMRSLVIVESPAKAKTIEKYLGREFDVRASIGHIADLPSKGLAIDIQNGFKPAYELTERGAKVVKELRAALKGASALYLATEASSYTTGQLITVDGGVLP